MAAKEFSGTFMMVPLTMRLRYRGFDCLVEPNYNFAQGTVAFGKKELDFYQSASVQGPLMSLGKLLNLKGHIVKGRTANDSAQGEILVSQNMQVVAFPKLTFENLVIQDTERIQQEIKKLNMSSSSWL